MRMLGCLPKGYRIRIRWTAKGKMHKQRSCKAEIPMSYLVAD